MMRRSAAIVGIGLLLATASAEAKPKIKPIKPLNDIPVAVRKTGGSIAGKQYIVLNSGAKTIADNGVFYISCNEEKCDALYKEIAIKFSDYAVVWNDYRRKQSELTDKEFSCFPSPFKGEDVYEKCKKEAKEATELRKKLEANRPIFQGQYLREALVRLSEKSELVRTDFDGNYSLNCPTSKCLVFSIGKAGNVTGYWLKIVDASSKFDMTNSSLLFDTDISH